MSRACSVPFLFVAGLSLATAQTDPVLSSTSAPQECILTTPAATWTALGATPEEVERIADIQALCHTDCNAVDGEGRRSPEMAGAIIRKHENDIEAILGAERFAKWKAFCKERPARM